MLLGRRQALLDVARNLGRATDLQESLDEILLRSREVMACEVCSILLPEEATGDLLIRSTRTEDGDIWIPSGEGISGQVFSTRKPVNIRDAQSDVRHYRPTGEQSGLITRAMLTIPLLDGDRCLGVMQAINPLDGTEFDRPDEEIFEAFGGLVSVTLIRLEAQAGVVRDAERRRELTLANEIQTSFLPADAGDVGGIRVETYYESASEVGGDFYFWHVLGDGSVLLGVGDVCGKGLAAALDMARGTTMISAISHLAAHKTLGEWVGELNSRLCSVMAPGRFIAATFLHVSADRRRGSACMAGAMCPYYLRGGKWAAAAVPAMPALGISCDARYESAEFSTVGIDALLLMTDGLLELRRRDGKVFEEGGFGELLQSLSEEEREPLAVVVGAARRAFARDPVYHDDATMLLIRPAPPPDEECLIDCCAENIGVAREFVEAWSQFAGLDERDAGLAVLGVDEVLTNICRHAYKYGGGPVWCRAEVVGSGLSLVLEHSGEGISGEDVDVQPLTSERFGGRGMHVIHTVFDEVVFEKVEADAASGGTERFRISLTKVVSKPGEYR